MHTKIMCVSLMQIVKHSFPLIISLTSRIRMSNLNSFITSPKFIPLIWKVCNKWSQQVLLHTDLVTPSQAQGHRKWYKIVEVNSAFKLKVWIRWKSLYVMSNPKVFFHATLQDGPTDRQWPANQPDEHNSIDLYFTHIDQKSAHKHPNVPYP